MRAITLIALLFGTAFTLGLNDAFHGVLNGETEFSYELLEKMYEQYNSEYNPVTRPSSHYIQRLSAIDRKGLFAAKVKEIIAHNTDAKIAWKKGLNEYSDMTDAEFSDYFHIVGDAQECSATHEYAKKAVPLEVPVKDVPAHWDWRDYGVVTPVKNQAKCGSCWTFSTVGCMEAHFMKKYGQFRNLSEQ